MDESKVYGGAPIAELVLDTAGHYTVDVMDYVKNHAPEEYIFAITSEDTGGTEYLNLGFDGVPFTEGEDYTAFGGYEGTVDAAGGRAGINAGAAGEGIKLLNVFGSGGASCEAGKNLYRQRRCFICGRRGGGCVGLCAADSDTLVPAGRGNAEPLPPARTETLTLTYTPARRTKRPV